MKLYIEVDITEEWPTVRAHKLHLNLTTKQTCFSSNIKITKPITGPSFTQNTQLRKQGKGKIAKNFVKSQVSCGTSQVFPQSVSLSLIFKHYCSHNLRLQNCLMVLLGL